jgi:hypothetical protein
MAMNPRLLRPLASGAFSPKQIAGLALWLDGADSSSLYTTDAGPGVAAVSSPLDIAGCVGWWDASDATTITESGGLVSQLSDKSGQGNHATASGALRPTLTASGLNGLSVLNFGGTQGLQGNLASSVVSNAYSVFVVCRVIGGITNGRLFSISSAAAADYGSGLVIPCLSNGTNLSAFSGTSGTNVSAVAGFASYAVFGGVLSANQVANAANGMSNTPVAATLSATITRFGIGIAAQGGTGLNTADIAEIIYYPSALSPADRARVEAYLANKWGIANVHAPATSASDPVGYWGDRSGNGRHATQSTAASRPVVGSQNGRNALTFDGSNDNLFVEDYAVESNLPGLTRFLVFEAAAVSQIFVTTTTAAKNASAGGSSWWQRFGPNWYGYCGSGIRYHGGTADTAAHVATNFFDGSLAATFGVRLQNSIDGVLLPVVGSLGTLVATTSGSSAKLAVGSNAGLNNFVNGRLCELLCYNRALTDAERRKAEIYLARKWGITLAPQVSNADAQDWVNRVYAAGGTVSTSTANAVNTFCDAIDAAGIRDRFYRLNLFAGTGLNAALVPLYRGQSRTGTQYGNTTDTNTGPFVSGDYAETGASGGLKGNGSTKYLDTGLAGTTFSAGDRHCSAYWNANSTLTGNRAFIGNTDASTAVAGVWFDIHSRHANPGSEAQITNSYGLVHTGAGSHHQLAQYTGATAASSYSNGGDKKTRTDFALATPATSASNWFVFGLNPSLFGGVRTDARICNYSIGLSMTDANALAFYNAVHAFQTALARQA